MEETKQLLEELFGGELDFTFTPESGEVIKIESTAAGRARNKKKNLEEFIRKGKNNDS